MPRLFTGVEIPADIALMLEFMRGGIPGARWIDRESYHITLRFAGDIDEAQARELAGALDRVEAAPFTLQLKGVDVFGGNKPHSLHVTLAASPELKRLQAAHERVCQLMGFEPEGRKFIPHVSLARLKDAPALDLLGYLAAHNLYASRPFEVGRFALYSSRPSRGGGPYAIEEVYPLNAG